MSWTISEVRRSYPCNPELLKFLRAKKRWSQKQLAKEAGYSERLICKAESGGSVSADTIEVLAKALSSKDMKVHPEDLIADPIALSKKFVEAMHTLRHDIVKGIAHFTDPRGEFNFIQTAKAGNYAGCNRGLAEMNLAAEKFFDAQDFVAGQDYKTNYQYYGDGNDVVAWGTSTLEDKKTGEIYDVNITFRMFYKKGRLCRIEERSAQGPSAEDVSAEDPSEV